MLISDSTAIKAKYNLDLPITYIDAASHSDMLPWQRLLLNLCHLAWVVDLADSTLHTHTDRQTTLQWDMWQYTSKQLFAPHLSIYLCMFYLSMIHISLLSGCHVIYLPLYCLGVTQ